MENIFTDGWETRLETELTAGADGRKTAYVCSPLRGSTRAETYQNMITARAYMYYAIRKMDLFAKAPHAYLPLLLDDAVPSERDEGLFFGSKMLLRCDAVLVCGTRLSQGMTKEILQAAAMKIPITVYDENLFTQVKEMVVSNVTGRVKLTLDRNHPFLASGIPADLRREEMDLALSV